MTLFIRQARLLSIMLLLVLGLASLPVSPVAAANCSAIGPGAYLAGCDLSGMDLSGVDLSGANLRGADLTGTTLDGANLSGANLSDATVTEGALDTANTAGANLRGITWVPAAPTLTLTDNSFVEVDGNRINLFTVTGTGFLPNTAISFEITNDLGDTGESLNSATSDINGSFTKEFGNTCGTVTGRQHIVTATDGVDSAVTPDWIPVLC